MYKLYFGDEWLELSVDSVASSMYRILFVISNVSWGENKDLKGDDLNPIIERLEKKYPGKILILKGSWNKQLEQVKAGLYYIKQNIPQASHCLYIDSDEIYSKEELKKLLKLIYLPKYFNRAIRIQYNTYFKTIYRRIVPRKWPLHLVLFPLRSYVQFKDPRNMITAAFHERSDIQYEHFAYVRKCDEKIRDKIEAHRETEPIIGDWYHDVWLKWTSQTMDFHPTHPEFWETTEYVPQEKLPTEVINRFHQWKNSAHDI